MGNRKSIPVATKPRAASPVESVHEKIAMDDTPPGAHLPEGPRSCRVPLQAGSGNSHYSGFMLGNQPYGLGWALIDEYDSYTEKYGHFQLTNNAFFLQGPGQIDSCDAFYSGTFAHDGTKQGLFKCTPVLTVQGHILKLKRDTDNSVLTFYPYHILNLHGDGGKQTRSLVKYSFGFVERNSNMAVIDEQGKLLCVPVHQLLCNKPNLIGDNGPRRSGLSHFHRRLGRLGTGKSQLPLCEPEYHVTSMDADQFKSACEQIDDALQNTN